MQDSKARIERNNISNNGEWELKTLGDAGQIEVKNNWWGTQDIDKVRVMGSVEVAPILKKPMPGPAVGETII